MAQDVGFTELAKFNIELDKRMGNKCCIHHTQNDLAVHHMGYTEYDDLRTPAQIIGLWYI